MLYIKNEFFNKLGIEKLDSNYIRKLDLFFYIFTWVLK